MKKIVLGALLLSVSWLPQSGVAAGNAVGTAMQVSFTVLESCTVQAPDGARSAPTVACVHEAPVQVSAEASQLAPSQHVDSADGRAWQIYF